MDTADDNDINAFLDDRVDGDKISYKTREWRGKQKNNTVTLYAYFSNHQNLAMGI